MDSPPQNDIPANIYSSDKNANENSGSSSRFDFSLLTLFPIWSIISRDSSSNSREQRLFLFSLTISVQVMLHSVILPRMMPILLPISWITNYFSAYVLKKMLECMKMKKDQERLLLIIANITIFLLFLVGLFFLARRRIFDMVYLLLLQLFDFLILDGATIMIVACCKINLFKNRGFYLK
jgi:hypothetical protein